MGELASVDSRRPKALPSARKMLGEGCLRIEFEVKTSAPTLATGGPAAPSAAEPSGIGIYLAVVSACHVVKKNEGKYRCSCESVCRSDVAVCYVILGFGEVAYIVLVMVCWTVSASQQPCAGGRREAVSIR